MLDINYIRQSSDEVVAMLRARQLESEIPRVAELLDLDRQRRELVQQTDDMKALRNRVSREVADMKKSGSGPADELIGKMKSVAEDISACDTMLKTIEAAIEDILLALPNRLHQSVPEGRNAGQNIVCKPAVAFDYQLDFVLKNHLELGKSLGILDFERGAKVGGAGFPVYTGKGARLERSLINFMLDTHTSRHGYTEIFPPFLVNRESLRGTGQWPKFADQVYTIEEDGLYAIPTAEVPVTNLHRGEMLEAADLPVAYAAYSACFRREAGSYGKDTRGFLRVHQFNKVEMVRFTRPEASYEALEAILGHAEAILQ
ncbi:serine--tRNA ligase, partial [Chlorobium sp.]|uniref:serine--tRNA ligase n=1 Tax=Chlorobium sp. TaxID=1095 RepID=UPI003C4C999F